MTVNNTTLGCCPKCEQPIPDEDLLLKYRSPADETALFAKCPGCLTVVTPS
jgi:hypothetical protein